MDSLPHLKIYSKLPVKRQGNRTALQQELEVTNEVDDDRKTGIDQGFCLPLPQEPQKGEGPAADGVHRDDGLPPSLCGLSAAPSRPADPVGPQAGGGGGGEQEKTTAPAGRKYDQKVLEILKVLWEMLDYLCGKRLVAILPEIVPILERHRRLTVDRATRERLLQISAASVFTCLSFPFLKRLQRHSN